MLHGYRIATYWIPATNTVLGGTKRSLHQEQQVFFIYEHPESTFNIPPFFTIRDDVILESRVRIPDLGLSLFKLQLHRREVKRSN